MAGRGETKQKSSQSHLSIIIEVIVVLIVVGIVTVRGMELRSKLDDYNERKVELETQIAKETRRREEIEQYSKYTQTDQYVEEIAREKLGLVKNDEIIFHNEDAK